MHSKKSEMSFCEELTGFELLERSHGQFRIVGNDTVHLPLGKPQHRILIIYRPGQHFAAIAVHLIDQSTCDQ